MPYIITTKSRVKVTRRAVATLDEAQDGCYWIAVDHGTTSEGAASIAIPHDGGTIGPLPDGTVIEVERVSLAALAGSPVAQYNARHTAEIIDAYNAAQDS
jgi:hypothetical protein